MSLRDSGLQVESLCVDNTETTYSEPAHASARKGRRSYESRAFEAAFQQLIEAIKHELKAQKQIQFTVSLAGEDTEFVRFNQSQVRQTGHVQDGQITVTLIATHSPSHRPSKKEDPRSEAYQTSSLTLPFTGKFASDWAIAQPALRALADELSHLPVDPYAALLTANPGNLVPEHSYKGAQAGDLLPADRLATTILEPVQALDFSGLYAGGSAYRAYADSTGKQHWFETASFTLDYSLFGEQDHQAAKGTFAGQKWNSKIYTNTIAATAQQLALLSKPTKSVPRGSYRTYLAPAAVADIVDTIIWGGGLGEAALRQGNSAFGKLEKGEAQLSDKFSLQEDFERVAIPRFNGTGAIAPAQLPIIQNGQWANSLVNERSAKEYGKVSNGANLEEAMRAPSVLPGSLDEADVLTALGTGLYLSNLHYLNWSDLNAGRITGMTRYACFWVENGEIVAPIENLRFDDDLYRFLGPGLIDLTRQQTFIPAVGTYDRRSLGGMWMPGMLIDQFRYTL